MAYLTSQNIVHRDLAARNILLSDDEEMNAKIADFGLARLYEGKYYRVNENKSKLPILWSAPEGCEEKFKFNWQSDVWSFGILMWELMSPGKDPYSNIQLPIKNPSVYLKYLKN